MFPSPSAKDKKVIVVTGCNSGVGLALVKQLVLEASSAVTGHGHFINNIEVVMACRNKVKAQAALDSLNLPSSSHTTRALVSIVECNLNSFPSIVKCCDWLKKT